MLIFTSTCLRGLYPLARLPYCDRKRCGFRIIQQIEKRCKRLNIPKLPQGNWAKLKNGVPHREALFELGWLWEEIFAFGDRLEAAEQNLHEEEA